MMEIYFGGHRSSISENWGVTLWVNDALANYMLEAHSVEQNAPLLGTRGRARMI